MWGGRPGGDLPGGQEAEDIVYGAIAKLLDGRRVWDPATEPDLDRFLSDVVESDLNHLAMSFENRKVVRESAMTPVWIEGEASRPLETSVPSATPEPLDVLAQREAREEGDRFVAGLLAACADDPPLQRAATLILEGVAKPADIAAKLGVPIDEIYNMRKRLQRRLTDFMTEWRNLGEREQGGPS